MQYAIELFLGVLIAAIGGLVNKIWITAIGVLIGLVGLALGFWHGLLLCLQIYTNGG